MINLLPPVRKEELRREATFRLTVVASIAVNAGLLAFVLMLLSVRVYLWGEIESQRVQLSSLREGQTAQEQQLQQEIRAVNADIAKLEEFYGNPASLPLVFEHLAAALPESMHVTAVTYTPSEKRPKLTLAGFAPRRDTLLQFRQNLEGDSFFEEVSFPPSNWVTREDIDFAGSVEVNFRPE